MSNPAQWKVAWITGASSGIGRELALALAREGITVAATGRRAEALAELASSQANVRAYPCDVSNLEAVRATHAAIERDLGPIDLAILSAGVWDAMGARDFSAERIKVAMDINYQGVVNCLEPLLPPMLSAGRGRVGIVSSVAGYRGLPRAVAYAPGKAALIALAETLRFDLEPRGVGISIINPGFVATPMTAVNKFPMPGLLTAEDAGRRILEGLKRGKFEIAFPWGLVSYLKVARILPYALYFPLASFMTGLGRRSKDDPHG